jgi:prophage antirepressor-like protein
MDIKSFKKAHSSELEYRNSYEQQLYQQQKNILYQPLQPFHPLQNQSFYKDQISEREKEKEKEKEPLIKYDFDMDIIDDVIEDNIDKINVNQPSHMNQQPPRMNQPSHMNQPPRMNQPPHMNQPSHMNQQEDSSPEVNRNRTLVYQSFEIYFNNPKFVKTNQPGDSYSIYYTKVNFMMADLRYLILIANKNIEPKGTIKNLRDIQTIHDVNRDQGNTIYINESGLYKLVLRSRMKLAKEFQVWIIEDALPKLRKYGFYQVDNKTKTKIKELNHKIALLTKSNNKLKNNMTKNKYPSGLHFYVLKDDGMYKIGHTKDLNKRLSTYNTGKANKAEYSYYKKTECAKEIEECMKSLLNEYIYKSNKEFYKCSLNKIIKEVKKCLEIEDNCNKCSDIKNNLKQTGGNNYILEGLLKETKEEYKKLITSIKY